LASATGRIFTFGGNEWWGGGKGTIFQLKILFQVKVFVLCLTFSLVLAGSQTLLSFDPSSLVWEDLTYIQNGAIPPPRHGHSMLSVGSLIYMFGGMNYYGIPFSQFLKSCALVTCSL
jgi:hypothetical protein